MPQGRQPMPQQPQQQMQPQVRQQGSGGLGGMNPATWQNAVRGVNTGMSKPDDSGIQQAQYALMRAQASGASPSEIAGLQWALNQQMGAYQDAMGSYGQDQQRQYLQGMQQANQPIGAGSIGGWGQTTGPTTQLRQDPFIAQLLGNRFGQGFSSGGGIRS